LQVIRQRRYNKSVDWYALGILIYEMLTGLPPFRQQQDESPMHLYARIELGAAAIRWPDAISPLARDIVLRFIAADPSERFGNLRNGAGDVFGHGWFHEVDWEQLGARKIKPPYMPCVVDEGDARAFEGYAEDEAAMADGLAADDPHGVHFPDFEYSTGEPKATILRRRSDGLAQCAKRSLSGRAQRREHSPDRYDTVNQLDRTDSPRSITNLSVTPRRYTL
jgi:protein kinase A